MIDLTHKRRMHGPLFVALILTGAVAGFLGLLANSASSYPIITSTGVITTSGQTKSAILNIHLFGRVVYTHASMDSVMRKRGDAVGPRCDGRCDTLRCTCRRAGRMVH